VLGGGGVADVWCFPEFFCLEFNPDKSFLSLVKEFYFLNIDATPFYNAVVIVLGFTNDELFYAVLILLLFTPPPNRFLYFFSILVK
jgi:hypothetical protein